MNKLTQEELNGLSPRARKAHGESNEILQEIVEVNPNACLLYTSPSPRDKRQSRMPSSA